jgi:trehalose-phosphatase
MSADLLDRWEEVLPRLDAARAVCVLADFDGTLTPLAESPDLARLSPEVRRVVESLASNPKVVFGVVSGRALEDLEPRLELRRIWTVGNHGFEIRNPAGDLVRYYDEGDVKLVSAVADEVERAAAGIPGAFVERKGPIAALHYRRADPARAPEIERGFLSVLERHHRHVMISRGHCVLEVRLRSSCNKGMAVRSIRKALPAGALTVYFGDDLTDRDAFRELRQGGVSVEVGAADSAVADYVVPGPEAVIEVLDRMDGLLRARHTRPRPVRKKKR